MSRNDEYDDFGEDYPDDYDPDYGEDFPQEYPREEYNNKNDYRNEQIGRTLGIVLQSLTEYARTLEHEKSNRIDIERKRQLAISAVHTERDVMIQFLSHRFGERTALYNQYFMLIDKALDMQNEATVHLVLENILNIYQDNPCAGIEEFRKQIESISEVVRI